MSLVSLRQLLDHAAENGYGLPAFNVNNLEQVTAIMEAAHEADSPVIMQASAGARKYAGEAFLRHLIDAAVEYCHLSQWKEWTFRPLEPIPRLDYDLAADFFKFHLKVFRTDFPSTLIELERSIKTNRNAKSCKLCAFSSRYKSKRSKTY